MRQFFKSISYNYSDLLILVLVFFLPFSIPYTNGAIILLIISSIVKIIDEKRMIVKLYWFLPVLFLYHFISGIWSGASWSFLEKNLLFLAIPLFFAQHSNFHRVRISRIGLAFILGNVTASLACLIKATIMSIGFTNQQIVFYPNVEPGATEDFLNSSVMGGNYFFSDHFSFFIHPSYFGLYVAFAQSLVYFVVRSQEYKKWNYTLIGSYIFFIIIIFLLSSKAAIFSSIGLTSGIIYVWIKREGTWLLKISSVIGVAIMATLFVFYNPRLKAFKDTLSISQFISPDPHAQFGHDLRILSWNAAFEVIKNNWILGVGEGNKETALTDVYMKRGYDFAGQQKFNSHNQYLDYFIGGGIFAFSLFLFGLAQLIFTSFKKNNKLLLVFLLIFSF